MTMMLLAMFAAAGVGIVGTRFGRRETALCVASAIGLTLIYFLRPWYMT